MSEAAQRELALDLHESQHAERLTVARKAMEALYRRRFSTYWYADCGAYVTADDARRWLRDHPEYDTPNRNWMGAIFTRKDWKAVGDHISTTPGSHSNRLRKWVLR
jgi:hypothetical protein